jgi:hypothetical protein
MLRRLGVAFVLLVCVAGVVGFQATRPSGASGGAQAFVPSPRFYMDFSPSFRTTIADAYWLLTVQYYGEHINGDHRLGALKDMLNLVTDLSPRFRQPYLFGSFALVDAGWARAGYDLLVKGNAALPEDWRLTTTLGAFTYEYAGNRDKATRAAEWYRKAAEQPGRPEWVPRVAAALLAKGGEGAKAALLWAQVYGSGDRYSQQKAVQALDVLLPTQKEARMQAVAKLALMMTPAQLNALTADLFKGY